MARGITSVELTMAGQRIVQKIDDVTRLLEAIRDQADQLVAAEEQDDHRRRAQRRIPA